MVLKGEPYFLLDAGLDWNRNAQLHGSFLVLDILKPWEARYDLTEHILRDVQGVSLHVLLPVGMRRKLAIG